MESHSQGRYILCVYTRCGGGDGVRERTYMTICVYVRKVPLDVKELLYTHTHPAHHNLFIVFVAMRACDDAIFFLMLACGRLCARAMGVVRRVAVGI